MSETEDPIIKNIVDLLSRYEKQIGRPLTQEEKRFGSLMFVGGCVGGACDLFTMFAKRFGGATPGMLQDQLQGLTRYAHLGQAFEPGARKHDN